MDDETLIRNLREDSGAPPPAPEHEWQVVQVRIAITPDPSYFRNALWLGGGVTLALAGVALALWLPLRGRPATVGELTSEDSAVVLEQLMAEEQLLANPPVADSGARWLALMDGVQD